MDTAKFVSTAMTHLARVMILAAVLTGGEVTQRVIQESGAGYARTRGGFKPLVMSMGYLGPAIFGGLLLLLNSVRGARAWILRATGLLILGTAAKLGGSPFTLLVAGAAGTTFLVLGWGLWPWVQFHLVNVMAVAIGSSGLRSLRHLFLVSAGQARGVAPTGIGHSMSDADQMAKLTGVPPVFWAGLWIAIAAWILWKGLRRALAAE